MAVVLPLLVMFAFGIIDVSRLLNADMQLSQAARQGARLAALAPASGASQTAIYDQVVDDTHSILGADAAVAVDVTLTYDYKGILFLAGGKQLQKVSSISCGG